MGLKKDFEVDESGVVLSYWHLAYIVQHLDAEQVEVRLHGYVSEAAYKAKKRPIGRPLQYTLVRGDFPEGTDLRALTSELIYRAIKAKATAASKLPRDGNPARMPEINGIPTDPTLADADDFGVGSSGE